MELKDLIGSCLRFDAFVCLGILMVSIAYRLFVKPLLQVRYPDLGRRPFFSKTFLVAAAFLASLQTVLALANLIWAVVLVAKEYPIQLENVSIPNTILLTFIDASVLSLVYTFYRRTRLERERHLASQALTTRQFVSRQSAKQMIAAQIFDTAISVSAAATVTMWLITTVYLALEPLDDMPPNAILDAWLPDSLFSTYLVVAMAMSSWAICWGTVCGALLWSWWLWKCLMPICPLASKRRRKDAAQDTPSSEGAEMIQMNHDVA